MKRITLLLIISAVILLFSSCATLQSLTQPTITYQDGDVITYLLPPEFPELNQEQMEYVPVSVGYVGYAICIRQVIGDDKYAIFITNDNNAEIFGSASIIGEETRKILGGFTLTASQVISLALMRNLRLTQYSL